MLRYGLIRGLPAWLAGLVLVLVAAWPLAAVRGAVDPAAAGRVTLFGSLGGLLLVLAVVLAARAGRDLAGRDRSWLAPRPASPAGSLSAFLAGTAGAWLLAVLGLGLGAQLGLESRAPGDEPALRQGRALPGPDLVLLGPATPTAAWVIEDPSGRLPEHGGLAFLGRVLGGAGPSAELTIELTREDAATTTTLGLGGARRLAAPLPPGAGPVVVRLSQRGAPVRLTSAEAFAYEAVGSMRQASVSLGLRLALLGLGAVGLALGLGAHMRPLLASLGVLALGLVGLGEGPASALLGSGAWVAALASAGEGWVPAGPGLRDLAGTTLGLVLGWSLARLALGRAR